MSRWPRRQTEGFPIRGRRGGRGKTGNAAPKNVALELGRVGFDYDRGQESQESELRDDQEDDQEDRGRDQRTSGRVSDRASGVHRRPGSGGSGGGRRAGSGLGRGEGSDAGEPLSPFLQDASEHDMLLDIGGGSGSSGERGGGEYTRTQERRSR